MTRTATGTTVPRSEAGGSVSAAPTAAVILHHQPEPPRLARAAAVGAAARACLRLTARANLSSDDLAVTTHALTAVAEVKVRA